MLELIWPDSIRWKRASHDIATDPSFQTPSIYNNFPSTYESRSYQMSQRYDSTAFRVMRILSNILFVILFLYGAYRMSQMGPKSP
jgi:hypothetical protein